MTQNKKNDSGYEELYVSMTNVREKRKGILMGIKNSLQMQSEHERIMDIRKNKALISKEIKISLDEINKLYLLLRKELPNVKNILSFTEKEINELERQINTLKIDTQANKRDIHMSESMKNKMETSNTNIRKIQKTAEDRKTHKKEEQKEELVQISTSQHKLSKLDRIQNNLKVIEAKLKNL